jgi:hypothetical protein
VRALPGRDGSVHRGWPVWEDARAAQGVRAAARGASGVRLQPAVGFLFGGVGIFGMYLTVAENTVGFYFGAGEAF